MTQGVDYCGPARRATRFLSRYIELEIFMKYWPGGSYLVMKIIPRDTGGRTPMDIG